MRFLFILAIFLAIFIKAPAKDRVPKVNQACLKKATKSTYQGPSVSCKPSFDYTDECPKNYEEDMLVRHGKETIFGPVVRTFVYEYDHGDLILDTALQTFNNTPKQYLSKQLKQILQKRGFDITSIAVVVVYVPEKDPQGTYTMKIDGACVLDGAECLKKGYDVSQLEPVLLNNDVVSILKKALSIVWNNIQQKLIAFETTKTIAETINDLQEKLGISNDELSILVAYAIEPELTDNQKKTLTTFKNFLASRNSLSVGGPKLKIEILAKQELIDRLIEKLKAYRQQQIIVSTKAFK